MPIQFKEYFQFDREVYPLVTIYDEDDIEEVRISLKNTKNIAISLADLKILPLFPCLRKIVLLSGLITEEGKKALYSSKSIEVIIFKYEETDEKAVDQIDLSQFPNLQAISSDSDLNFCNLANCSSLKTLKVRHWRKENLKTLKNLSELDSLEITFGKLVSLAGVEYTSIQCLDLGYLKKLSDISFLTNCKRLKSLQIDHCPNIDHLVDVVQDLKGLVKLSISGNKGVFRDLRFIKNLINLQFFVTDFNILDGKLEILKSLPYSSVLMDRRHYSLKDEDLFRDPKVSQGNEGIPSWWRID